MIILMSFYIARLVVNVNFPVRPFGKNNVANGRTFLMTDEQHMFFRS